MRLRISSIDPTVNKENLEELFSDYGEVNSIKIFRGIEASASPAVGFVTMKRERDALQAIENLDGFMLGDFHLKVELSEDSIRLKSATGVKRKPIQVEEDEEDEDTSVAVLEETKLDKSSIKEITEEIEEEEITEEEEPAIDEDTFDDFDDDEEE